MRHRLLPSLILVASLAACRAPGVSDPKPGKSAAPGPTGSTAPAKPTGTVSLLKPLPGKVAKLAGQVYVDAAYATTAAGATRLQGKAGAVAGAGGATLITNDGGS